MLTDVRCSTCKQVLELTTWDFEWFGTQYRGASLACLCDRWNVRGPRSQDHVRRLADFYITGDTQC